MKHKDDLAVDKILEYAKCEFMQKGYEGASMRSIAENAGYTTGMVYARFADKNELFRALVKGPADKLYNYFVFVQNDFAEKDVSYQWNDMHCYVDKKIDTMIDMIYADFDAFKLIISKSNGSEYENYVDKMVEVETENTFRFTSLMNANGIAVPEVRRDFAHMIASALFNGMFQVVDHDLDKTNAREYIKKLQEFFNAGWDKILGLPH